MKCEFECVGAYNNEEFCNWEWKCVMTTLKKPFVLLGVGVTVNLIRLIILGWDRTGGGEGKIKRLVEYNKGTWGQCLYGSDRADEN